MFALWSNTQKLNREQCNSLFTAIRHKFQLIQGPPGDYSIQCKCIVCIYGLLCTCSLGTGKSVTGAHLAYASVVANNPDFTFVPSSNNEKIKCVMYCGPSNKSVDVVLGMSCYVADYINTVKTCLYKATIKLFNRDNWHHLHNPHT